MNDIVQNGVLNNDKGKIDKNEKNEENSYILQENINNFNFIETEKQKKQNYFKLYISDKW